MVKTCDMEIAEEYGIEKFPSIVYFENGIPYLYPGTLIFQYTTYYSSEDSIDRF